MLLYISGRYSAPTKKEIEHNIYHARQAAIKAWEMGHAVICPHLNTAHMEEDCKIEHEDYLKGDLAMIARCDAIYMLEYWEDSKGAREELEYALSLGVPVYYETTDGIPPLHPTEVRCPTQAKAFAEVVGKMYRVHLSKNADYSPSNIIGTGFVGLVTRLWDKMARLMNLSGFKLVLSSASFEQPKEPNHESIDDTLMDMAVYAIIGHLLRAGKWGR